MVLNEQLNKQNELDKQNEVKSESLARWLPSTRRSALIAAIVMIGAIAVTDALLTSNVSLGVLYFFPIVISAGYLTAGEIVGSVAKSQ